MADKPTPEEWAEYYEALKAWNGKNPEECPMPPDWSGNINITTTSPDGKVYKGSDNFLKGIAEPDHRTEEERARDRARARRVDFSSPEEDKAFLDHFFGVKKTSASGEDSEMAEETTRPRTRRED